MLGTCRRSRHRPADRILKFGLAYANTIPFTEPALARSLGLAAEAAGFESLWTVEHVIWPTDYSSTYPYHPTGKMPGDPSIPIPDPLIWLTWVAAATSTIRLGTGVMILPLRNPLVVAKEIATLDYLSEGRVELGIGVGWLEEEFDALGVSYAGRGQRTNEMIGAMRSLWRDDDAAFKGAVVSFESVSLNPKPVSGSVPVTIGGHSRFAARRAATLGDGFYPGPGSLEGLGKAMATLQDECDRADREIGEIEVSAVFPGRFMKDPHRSIESLVALGVDRIMVPAYEVTRPDLDAGMDAFAAIAAAHR